MNSGIYTIENTIDCKLYVGYTKDFHKRRRCHWSELERGVHANDHLQRAVNLYGIDKFKFEILEEWSEDMLVCMEHWWCMMLNVHNDKYGYNINITHPHKKYASMSEQAKRRSSEKQKGREFTQEHKDRIREKRKSQVITEQHKQRTRQTILGRKDTDEVRRYKSEVEKSGKQQYVNQLGMSTWVDDKANLPQWFTHLCDKDKNPVAELNWRAAVQGEADLYEFMRSWLGKVNWFSATTTALLDMKKIFRGNMDDLRNLITAEADENLTDTVVFMATVYVKDGDDGKKMYQNIANVYMRGYLMKNVRLAAANNSWTSDKNTKRFMEQCTGDYGIKDIYALDVIKPFVEGEHLVATDETMRHSDGGSVDDTDY